MSKTPSICYACPGGGPTGRLGCPACGEIVMANTTRKRCRICRTPISHFLEEVAIPVYDTVYPPMKDEKNT